MSVFSNFLTNFNVQTPFFFLRFSARLSVAEVLRKKYGNPTLELVRKFEKTDIQDWKALLDLQFLKISEDHNVT